MPAASVSGLSHSYGRRQALCDLSLEIEQGEIFAVLGPNGGGKTTLFRVLSTLIPLRVGSVKVLGYDLPGGRQEIRRRIGVVFQSPSLDGKLTASENVRHQAALYGLYGAELRRREAEVLDMLGVADRARDLAETLSGGLRRRVELAKGMIHRPRLLLMDEPSTGLDPGARADLWRHLRRLQEEHGVTVALTTHLLEEAEKADRIAILSEGRLVALDTPSALKATVGGESIMIDCDDPESLADDINNRLDAAAHVVDGQVRLEQQEGHRWIARLIEAFPGRIRSVTLGQPTLEDVFIAKTGHRFWREEEEESEK